MVELYYYVGACCTLYTGLYPGLVLRPRCDLCTILSTAIVRVIFCSVPYVIPVLWVAHHFDADPDPNFHLNADPDNPGTNNSNKRGGGKGICCSNFFAVPNFTKVRMTYCIFEQVKKKK